MKKIVLAAMALTVGLSAAAQDTYESARLLGSDLNGTARYVGMGGAMEALGADISTIGTNPAGIGMFRHSQANVSFGFVSQQDVQKFDGLGKTNMSFDQVGFVYTNRISDRSFINFSFNYHKSRNFDQILSAAGRLNGQSVNGLSYRKAEIGNSNRGGYDLDFNNKDVMIGYENSSQDALQAQTYSQLDYMNANALLLDANYMALREKGQPYLFSMDGDNYTFDRAHRGWINDYDFNMSGNSDDRFYWGITVGIKDVNYKGYTEYTEGLTGSEGDLGYVNYGDDRRIKGTGFDLTAGVIVRPVEESPFRIGLSVKTPTWYDLTTENQSTVLNYAKYGAEDEWSSGESYDFKFYTPWKFGVSLGHTVGSNLALGASYEYSDYGASRNRINDGYDYYGNDESYTDELQKRNAESSLNGVHTLKLGAEYKPVPELSVRLGYNLQSAAYDDNGYRDQMLDSPGVMYASTADYTNWKATNRITCGLGYKAGKMNIDLAYQYSTTNGDFYPMQSYEGKINAVDVSNKRHQMLLTLGYSF